jgi:hypothetical protein
MLKSYFTAHMLSPLLLLVLLLAAAQVLGNQLAEYKRVFVPTAAFWGKGIIRRCAPTS